MTANMSLGERMKRYEEVSKFVLTHRSCLIIRVDGKAFHTFTKGADKPFDMALVESMREAALVTAREIQGCKLAYVQSDEASFLLTDFDKLTTQGWFGYELQKIVSVSASLFTAHFNRFLDGKLSCANDEECSPMYGRLAFFDSRAFVVPREDVSNYFLWRARDWERNSVQMLGQSHFSHGKLQGKKIPEIKEMLHEIGKDWESLQNVVKNGTFVLPSADAPFECAVRPSYSQINEFVEMVVSRVEVDAEIDKLKGQ